MFAMPATVPASRPTATAHHRDAVPRSLPSRTARIRATEDLLDRAALTRDPRVRRRLQDRAAIVNLEVAKSIASRYYGRGISAEDLDQVAYLALVKAVRRFDPCSAPDLLSYAVPTIAGELKRHFRDHGWMVRPPRRVTDLLPAVQRATERLRDRLGREPRPSEIAEAADLSVSDVVDVLSSDGLFALVSLDAPVGADDAPPEILGAPDPGFDRCENLLDLKRALRVLDERERLVVRLRYCDELSQDAIGRRLGVSQMQVSRILTRVHATLRAAMSEQDETPGDSDVWNRQKLVPAS